MDKIKCKIIYLFLGAIVGFYISTLYFNNQVASIIQNYNLDYNANILRTKQNLQTRQTKTNEKQTFYVTRVIDGDTIVVDGGVRIRLIGIDAPEKNEYFYQEATQALQQMVLRKNIKAEKDISETDRYGRLLRYVYIDDIFVNLELVRQGYAKAKSYPPDIKHQSEFLKAEQESIKNKNGIWQ